jgi:hypothetical protein
LVVRRHGDRNSRRGAFAEICLQKVCLGSGLAAGASRPSGKGANCRKGRARLPMQSVRQLAARAAVAILGPLPFG